MEFSRRGFLGTMLGALATEAIPFNRVWFIPNTVKPVNITLLQDYDVYIPLEIVPPKELFTISMITKEALEILSQNLTFKKNPSPDYGLRLTDQNFKIGDKINIRKPVRLKEHLETQCEVGKGYFPSWMHLSQIKTEAPAP